MIAVAVALAKAVGYVLAALFVALMLLAAVLMGADLGNLLYESQ